MRSPKVLSMVAFHFRAIVCFAFEPNTGSSTGNGVAFGGGGREGVREFSGGAPKGALWVG